MDMGGAAGAVSGGRRAPRVSRRALVLAAGGLLLTACGAEETVDIAELRLATGPAGAVYRRIGGGLIELIAARLPETTVTAVPSRASTDNIRLLREGTADLGLASLDAVIGAEGAATAGVSALCRLYDSYLHLVVLDDSAVRGFDDLDGRRVSIGARDSGTEFTSRRLIELAGIGIAEVARGQAGSASALVNGSIDAQFSLTGIPTPAISEIAAEHPIRLVPLREQAGLLVDEYPGPYVPATIPMTTYVGVAATPTVAVPNVLLARDDLDRDVARIVTETIFQEAEVLTTERAGAAAVPEAWQINVRTGISTGSVPLHPGAADWFREQKR